MSSSELQPILRRRVRSIALGLWLSRLESSGLVDLAEDGHRIVPELLDAYTPPNFELRVLDGSSLWIEEGAVVAELSAELYPFSGEVEGTGVIQRRIDTRRGKADHIKFELPEAAQGAGRGRRVLRASVELYQAVGITEIKLTAVDKGKYVWAAAGFAFATEDSRSEVLDGIEFAAELLGMSLADLDPDHIEPWQIAYMPPADDFTIRDALEALDPEGIEAVRDQADTWMSRWTGRVRSSYWRTKSLDGTAILIFGQATTIPVSSTYTRTLIDMTPVTKKTTSQGGLARSVEHLSRTSPQTARAIERYYTREQERGRKIPRPITASRKTSAGA